MVEVGIKRVPLLPDGPLLGARPGAHLLDEDPVAQALGTGALFLGLGKLDVISAEVDLHSRSGLGEPGRPRTGPRAFTVL